MGSVSSHSTLKRKELEFPKLEGKKSRPQQSPLFSLSLWDPLCLLRRAWWSARVGLPFVQVHRDQMSHAVLSASTLGSVRAAGSVRSDWICVFQPFQCTGESTSQAGSGFPERHMVDHNKGQNPGETQSPFHCRRLQSTENVYVTQRNNSAAGVMNSPSRLGTSSSGCAGHAGLNLKTMFSPGTPVSK